MLLKGENLSLGPLRKDDLDVLASWYEDVDFLRFYDYHAAVPKTRGQLEKIYENAGNDGFLAFAVRKNEDGNMMGLVEIDGISNSNGFAWVSIGFGAKTERGRGFGFEAMSLAIEFAFSELNLDRLQLNVISYNTAGIRLYEKLGFVREGVYREAVLRDGVRHDLYLYGLLRREWKNGNS
ncbi:MAG: GNAT family protein [Clostridia bacterium]